MSKITYKFVAPGHLVNITHHRKAHRSSGKNTYTSLIRIVCHGRDQASHKKFEVLLDERSQFAYFEGIDQFWAYLKKNKKKDIVDVDPSGQVKFMVKSKNDTENIPMKEIETLKVPPQQPQRYAIPNILNVYDAYRQEALKSKEEMRLMENLSLQRQPKENIMKKMCGQGEYFSQYGRTQKENMLITFVHPIYGMEEIPINEDNPFYELTLSSQAFIEKGFGIKLLKFNADMLYIGICFVAKSGQVNYWKDFKHGDTLEGDRFEVYLEDSLVVIKNLSRNVGKKFIQQSFPSEAEKCLIFVSIKAPEN